MPRRSALGLPTLRDLAITRLGTPEVPSPLQQSKNRFVGEDERILACSEVAELQRYLDSGEPPPAFEAAGPRAELFFAAAGVSCGIVTCGGLCPGVNDVIRSIVLTLSHSYGVRRILGFRYGYAGLSSNCNREPMFLDPQTVENINRHGGTVLGTSRGPQDLDEMVDSLVRWKIQMLFAIGGDGTLRGARALCQRLAERNLPISVIGVPKTIDNDLLWAGRSFGFATAVEEARAAVAAAHTEARAAWNGIGLVKLMGRHSGYIAAFATLASGEVNFCLVPEVPFTVHGKGGLLDALEVRLARRRHAVIVVAEGAGQELMQTGGVEARDASGNIRLKDIGQYLRDEIRTHFSAHGTPIDLKYIDPGYTIRSQPANTLDASFCLILGQHAVHAAMSGRTDMMVGWWNNAFTHVPLSIVADGSKQIDPQSETWQRVLDSTGQPVSMVGEGHGLTAT